MIDGKRDVLETKYNNLVKDMADLKKERDNLLDESLSLKMKCDSLELDIEEQVDEIVELKNKLEHNSGLENLSLYDLLLVDEKATVEQIKKHFKVLAMICHPDKGGKNGHFEKILEAKDILTDEEARAVYDHDGIEAAREQKNSYMDEL